MQVTKFKPAVPLQTFVQQYIVIESDGDLVNRVLPDTSLVMAFRFRGVVNHLVDQQKNKFPAAMISGLRKSGRLINYAPHSANFLVVFKEGGASAFFKEPVHLLFDDTISLESFTHYNNVGDIEAQLALAIGHEARVAIMDKFLLSKLNAVEIDDLVVNAIAHIHAAKGPLRMRDLASAMCMSQDAFEKRFRKVVGVSPKKFAYIVRMKSVVARGRVKSLAEIALDAGYFDQPHFNKDFKLFTGIAPRDFFDTPPAW